MRVAYHIHQHINTISNNTAMDFSSAFQPIIAFVALLLLRALYKIAGHPKQSKKRTKFPFPEPSGALPFIGHLHLLGANKPVARILGAMADKYGPIFSLRLGQQRTLIVSNWEMVKECLTTNDRIFATRPGIAVGKYIGYNNASFALSPYGHYWRDIRKMATLELFSTHRLELLKRVRISEVDSFIKELFPLCTTSSSSKSEAVVVPLSEMLEHLTFNLNLRLIVGKRFSEHMFDEKDSEVSRFKNAIKQALYLSGVFVWSDAIPWLEWLDVHGHVRSMKKTSKEIDAVLSKWLEDHKERKRECCGSIDVGVERDLMDVMLSTLSDEDVKSAGFTRDTVIKANALILLLTGTESTAVALTWTLSLLLNNPKALKAAQEEMDIHVGRNRWVDESDIPKLQYLQAILKESLRINPAGPITGPREAMEDCYIANQFVPKGTRLTVNIWKLHRDPQIWSDPCEFRPERFLTTHADVGFKGQNFEYIPFSLGRRSCPGTTLGLIVVQSVLARLIQGFDMRTKDGEPVDMSEGLGIALPKDTPLEVVLSPRLPLELYESL